MKLNLTWINIIGYLLYSMSVYGCCFSIASLIISSVPMAANVLGISEAIKIQDKMKALGLSALLALWLYYAWESNVSLM